MFLFLRSQILILFSSCSTSVSSLRKEDNAILVHEGLEDLGIDKGTENLSGSNKKKARLVGLRHGLRLVKCRYRRYE